MVERLSRMISNALQITVTPPSGTSGRRYSSSPENHGGYLRVTRRRWRGRFEVPEGNGDIGEILERSPSRPRVSSRVLRWPIAWWRRPDELRGSWMLDAWVSSSSPRRVRLLGIIARRSASCLLIGQLARCEPFLLDESPSTGTTR